MSSNVANRFYALFVVKSTSVPILGVGANFGNAKILRAPGTPTPPLLIITIANGHHHLQTNRLEMSEQEEVLMAEYRQGWASRAAQVSELIIIIRIVMMITMIEAVVMLMIRIVFLGGGMFNLRFNRSPTTKL